MFITSGEIEINTDVQEQPSKRPTYKQDWPSYERATQVERERVVALLRDLVAGVADSAPTEKPRACSSCNSVYWDTPKGETKPGPKPAK